MSSSKEKRVCPVVGREMSAAECGESRHAKYACPETCPHNPFSAANYNRLLELTDKADAAQMAWFKTQTEDMNWVGAEVSRAGSRMNNEELGMLLFEALHFRRGKDGRTVFERWERSGLTVVKNDLRVFLQRRNKIRISLLEVHQVIDDRQFLAVDLLEPGAGSFRVVDRSVTSRANRFGVWLVWTYDLPHFRRTHGACCLVPDIVHLDPVQILEITMEHLGCPKDPDQRRMWVPRHYLQLLEAVSAIETVRRHDGISRMDSSRHSVVYRYHLTLELARVLLSRQSFLRIAEVHDEEEGDGYVEAWDWTGDPVAGDDPPVVVGRVLLGPGKCRLEAFGGAEIAKLRKIIEGIPGFPLEFRGERVDDLGKQVLKPLDPKMVASVAPRLRENPLQLSMRMHRIDSGFDGDLGVFLRAWLDDPNPMLGGSTPRQAAKDPTMRTKVVRLTKGQIRRLDEACEAQGLVGVDCQILEEIGLGELNFPPPPRRPTPRDQE